MTTFIAYTRTRTSTLRCVHGHVDWFKTQLPLSGVNYDLSTV